MSRANLFVWSLLYYFTSFFLQYFFIEDLFGIGLIGRSYSIRQHTSAYVSIRQHTDLSSIGLIGRSKVFVQSLFYF